MRKSAKSLKIFAVALIVLFTPYVSHAQVKSTFLGPIVPEQCKCHDQVGPGGIKLSTAPDYGCVLQTTQNSVNFGVTLAIILFTIYLVITGFSFITSGGSGEARTKAKTRFTNVFIGLAVLLCAWLSVDYVVKRLYNEKTFGPWNSILAGKTDATDFCIVSRESTSLTSGSVAISPGTGTGGTVSTPGTGGGLGSGTSYTYDPGIEKQRSTASAPLVSLLTCMESKLPPGVGKISSISDSAIAAGARTFQQCAATGKSDGCHHTNYSCHFGGRACIGSSYAVDFGDQEHAGSLTAAGRACGATAIYNEGNHLHVSVGKASSCGCDN